MDASEPVGVVLAARIACWDACPEDPPDVDRGDVIHVQLVVVEGQVDAPEEVAGHGAVEGVMVNLPAEGPGVEEVVLYCASGDCDSRGQLVDPCLPYQPVCLELRGSEEECPKNGI